MRYGSPEVLQCCELSEGCVVGPVPLRGKGVSKESIASGKLCPMAADLAGAFAELKPVLRRYAKHLAVKADTSIEYTLVTKSASPFRQHKGQPLFFGSVRLGKAYASFHLMPIYMCPVLMSSISPALKKRMQGKTCFNFRTKPEQELVTDLTRLTEAGFKQWSERKWV